MKQFFSSKLVHPNTSIRGKRLIVCPLQKLHPRPLIKIKTFQINIYETIKIDSKHK